RRGRQRRGGDARAPRDGRRREINGADDHRVGGIGAADAVRRRLQRKMVRRAGGMFESQSRTIDGSPYPADGGHERRSGDTAGGRGGGAKRHPNASSKGRSNEIGRGYTPRTQAIRISRAFGGNSNDRDTPSSETITPRHGGDTRPPHKNNDGKNSKTKASKPKHLKRKMNQLSRMIAENNHGAETDIITVLEVQMKQLAEQVQELKRLKGMGQDVRDEQSPDGKFQVSGGCDVRAIDDSDCIHRDGKGDGIDITSDGVPTRPPSSKPSDDNSSSDEDVHAGSSNARSRGKRRRGQRDIACRRGDVLGDTVTIASGTIEANPISHAPEAKNGEVPIEGGDVHSLAILRDRSESTIGKVAEKRVKRRCIGRKPVTDFSIGNFYSGKIKYIKPKLGAFIDIGSHSDAFCHISCTSDAFVSSVTDILKVDDIVDVRVIEVDRERKRITVSMRSADVALNEEERLKTTRQYEHMTKGPNEHSGQSETSLEKEGFGVDESRKHKYADTSKDHKLKASFIYTVGHPSISSSANSIRDLKREKRIARRAERRVQSEHQILGSSIHYLDDGQMQSKMCEKMSTGQSGTDLKRERKLARRAERRAAMQATNTRPHRRALHPVAAIKG
ncbi:hypothetical protein ACHAXA_003015, partial [Cyclostephanos tholiformis]